MGSLAESSSLQTFKMMKSIAVVALCMFAAAAGEADASADAGYLYGHYGYGHLGYAHHGYYGYPYARHYGHYYGKRSADAEPTAAAEPKADSDAFYGYYGHGYGLAHHGYGYAHHGYYGYPYAHHGYYGYGHHLGYAHHGYYGYPYARRGYFYG